MRKRDSNIWFHLSHTLPTDLWYQQAVVTQETVRNLITMASLDKQKVFNKPIDNYAK